MTAGDDNRAAFAFLGTTTGGNYPDTDNFKGVWHLYVATTYDALASIAPQTSGNTLYGAYDGMVAGKRKKPTGGQ
ncbi:MAG: hypothetical protein HOY79_22650 [Streptomyces sp.]|nr:hypothetical protein [Streptomyces sp.]